MKSWNYLSKFGCLPNSESNNCLRHNPNEKEIKQTYLDRFIVKSCSKPHRTKFGNAPTQDGLNGNAFKNYPSCVDINHKTIFICESDTYIVYVLLLIELIFIALYAMSIV